MKIRILILFIVAFNLSCVSENTSSQANSKNLKPKLFINGKIYTVNEKQPWAESVLVDEKGVIKFVGKTEDAKKQVSKDAEIVDLKGKMMMPGIHDVHQHPLEAMSPFAGTCVLDSEETDAEEFIEVLKECPSITSLFV